MAVAATGCSTASLPAGTTSTSMGLRLPEGLSFGEWRRVYEALRATEERVLWSRGDCRAYADRFEDEHGDAIDAIDRNDRRGFEARAVALAFPETPVGEERRISDRMDGVSWSHHERVLRSVKDPAARETWLNEVKRHGWSRLELEARLTEGAIGGPRPPALTFRAVGAVVGRFERRAEALGVQPRELALEVLELASQLPDPLAVLEAAGAKRVTETP